MSTAVLVAAAAIGFVRVPATRASSLRPSSPSCASLFPSDLTGLSRSSELVTVTVQQPAATTASVELWERHARGPGRGCFTRTAGPFPANIGLNGTSTDRVEGDDTTPVGLFGFVSEIYGIDANPGVRYPYHRLTCGDWWDEEPTSPDYNRFVHVPCGTNPSFSRGSEALWTIRPSYDWMAVIDYNTSPMVPGKGSGIFLHVTVGRPTAGCVALPSADLLRTLRWLDPADDPRIAIGTTSQLAAL